MSLCNYVSFESVINNTFPLPLDSLTFHVDFMMKHFCLWPSRQSRGFTPSFEAPDVGLLESIYSAAAWLTDSGNMKSWMLTSHWLLHQKLRLKSTNPKMMSRLAYLPLLDHTLQIAVSARCQNLAQDANPSRELGRVWFEASSWCELQTAFRFWPHHGPR